MLKPRALLLVFCVLGLGCSTVRPLAQHGVDLMENTERSYAVRVTGSLGSVVGIVAAIPATIILLPTYPFTDWSEWGVREPTEKDGTDAPSDYAIPIAGMPFEYGMGMGAGIFGSPIAWLEEAVCGEPGPAEGWVEETPEEPSFHVEEDGDSSDGRGGREALAAR